MTVLCWVLFVRNYSHISVTILWCLRWRLQSRQSTVDRGRQFLQRWELWAVSNLQQAFYFRDFTSASCTQKEDFSCKYRDSLRRTPNVGRNLTHPYWEGTLKGRHAQIREILWFYSCRLLFAFNSQSRKIPPQKLHCRCALEKGIRFAGA